ncbi:MAG: hypothetical protein NTW64_00360 [Candidatus Omnitrophica bacterium]|nr:hypothetical protein [Candidatus Omnitrophota bacterium]
MIAHILIKAFAKINLWLGLLFRSDKPRYSFSDIRSVMVKRTDRIGDAVITLPLLLELKKHFQVTVLTSSYNDYFLKEFIKTRVFTDRPLDFLGCIKLMFSNLFLMFKRQKKGIPQYDLCLDLNGIRELNVLAKIKEENLCKYYASFNMGIWNSLLQYSYPRYPVLFSDKHILNTYRILVKEATGVEVKPPDYIDFSEKMAKPFDFNITESFILINISGIEKFRGPSPKMYAELINSLDVKGKILIMDELNRPHLQEFKEHNKRSDVLYLDKDLSIWELLYIAAKSLLYVGSDSGISHLLQMPTNAVLFFASPIPCVWKPYSQKPYNKSKIGNLLVEETVTSRGLRKKVIYRPIWCRPCFDIGCLAKSCIYDMDIKVLASEINSTIKNIAYVNHSV